MKSIIIVALLILGLLTGCQGASKQQQGGIGGGAGGAVIGGILGKQFGGDVGAIIGAIGGGVLGYWGGSKIGEYLDDQDKKKHEQATVQALETGQSQQWNNPETGTSGTVEITPVAIQSQSQHQVQIDAPERECRTINQSITLQDGTQQQEEMTACKGPNGWETV
jgi:surface antigen